MRRYHNGQFDPKTDADKVFVFGSNLLGLHGGGAAKFAMDYCRAIWGIGQGYQNSSIADGVGCYALPTKYTPAESMTITEVFYAIRLFVAYARTAKNFTFFVTRVGCGLAGFTDEEIAPSFFNAPDNCILPPEWKALMEKEDAEWAGLLEGDNAEETTK